MELRTLGLVPPDTELREDLELVPLPVDAGARDETADRLLPLRGPPERAGLDRLDELLTEADLRAPADLDPPPRDFFPNAGEPSVIKAKTHVTKTTTSFW
jgi:hypothetical protein